MYAIRSYYGDRIFDLIELTRQNSVITSYSIHYTKLYEKFRIAEAAVNQSLYKAWDLNAVVMPWPDVPVALKQGVIDALDHTPMVCNITKKFEVAKDFTQINYAQGLFIHMVNKAWFESLPKDP